MILCHEIGYDESPTIHRPLVDTSTRAMFETRCCERVRTSGISGEVVLRQALVLRLRERWKWKSLTRTAQVLPVLWQTALILALVLLAHVLTRHR